MANTFGIGAFLQGLNSSYLAARTARLEDESRQAALQARAEDRDYQRQRDAAADERQARLDAQTAEQVQFERGLAARTADLAQSKYDAEQARLKREEDKQAQILALRSGAPSVVSALGVSAPPEQSGSSGVSAPPEQSGNSGVSAVMAPTQVSAPAASPEPAASVAQAAPAQLSSDQVNRARQSAYSYGLDQVEQRAKALEGLGDFEAAKGIRDYAKSELGDHASRLWANTLTSSQTNDDAGLLQGLVDLYNLPGTYDDGYDAVPGESYFTPAAEGQKSKLFVTVVNKATGEKTTRSFDRDQALNVAMGLYSPAALSEQFITAQKARARTASVAPPALKAKEREELAKVGQGADEIARLQLGFQNDFGGRLSGWTGRTTDWLSDRTGLDILGGSQDSSSWWSQYQARINVIRNTLFGSALTEPERAEFERASINPGDSDEKIRRYLAIQESAAKRAARKMAESYLQDGYDPKSVEAAIGVKLADLNTPDYTDPNLLDRYTDSQGNEFYVSKMDARSQEGSDVQGYDANGYPISGQRIPRSALPSAAPNGSPAVAPPPDSAAPVAASTGLSPLAQQAYDAVVSSGEDPSAVIDMLQSKFGEDPSALLEALREAGYGE